MKVKRACYVALALECGEVVVRAPDGRAFAIELTPD